ncbi:MAG TPA: hypothetical protein VMR16_04030 [Candidatus Saccharimonadales bacterium]|nr:hypothetical protein [Candidatus Saccharimonadales bacterium]
MKTVATTYNTDTWPGVSWTLITGTIPAKKNIINPYPKFNESRIINKLATKKKTVKNFFIMYMKL